MDQTSPQAGWRIGSVVAVAALLSLSAPVAWANPIYPYRGEPPFWFYGPVVEQREDDS